MVAPIRGEVWLIDLNPVRGHEQAGRRPALVVSDDLFNQGPAGLVIVLPITSTVRRIPSHVEVVPPEGGLKVRSAVLCDGVRSISTDRLQARWGQVSRRTMGAVENALRFLMRL
ncbi:MAG TPA: type II toxin-antitoxin system PemK/MazF family toxin [Candidatus Acidoferrum sp.]|nr:type II toxin-antitoxin system PemK/MazF family toxin [Candidatus Acidoferrum sp.]